MISLILGGVKSGKSLLAENMIKQLEAQGKQVLYIATADKQYHDDEMKDRVAKHKAQRPSHWQTLEEPLDLSSVLIKYNSPNTCIMVDCLTLWITNHLDQKNEEWVETQRHFLDVLNQFTGDLIIVSNETNLGVTPMNALSRQFLDCAGILHQGIAAIADSVTLCVAGIPLIIKGEEA